VGSAWKKPSVEDDAARRSEAMVIGLLPEVDMGVDVMMDRGR
jgi:hypothetical protein